MKNTSNTLAEILTEKKELLRLFVIAALLGFSVNVLAGLVVTMAGIPSWLFYAGAIGLTAISLALLAADLRASLSFEDKIEAVILIDPNKNEVVNVKDYEFANDLTKVLSAIRAESKSIYSEWEKDPLVKPKTEPAPKPSEPETDAAKVKPTYIGIFKLTGSDAHIERPKASTLLNEAISFVLLEKLSLHLSTYFNDADGDSQVIEYRREDIPGFLLKNRVLNVLSTPIEQRDIFLNAFPNKENPPKGELVSLWGSDGSMYSRFDLTLPRDTKIRHSDTGSIKIETSRLEIELLGTYSGSSAVVSRAFIGQYLGRNPEDIECRKIAISLRCRVRASSLLTSKGWEYYRWLDSFRERLRTGFDFESFQEGIHWDVIDPLLYSIRGQFSGMRRQIEDMATARRDA